MNIKYLYPRTWDYLLKPVHLKGTAKNLTEAYEKTKPLLVASKIIVHLVCKMNWVTANKSSTYYDINYGASSCSQWSLRDLQNAASIWILNAVQAAYFVTFWMRLWISRNGDQFNYSQTLYWSMTACWIRKIKKLLIVSAVPGSL